MRKFVTILACLLLPASFNLCAIEIGSIADARFETGWTLDGDSMTYARAKLLSGFNFGAEGLVEEDVNITDIAGTITLTALSTFDVFFIGYLDDGSDSAFTDDELQAMQIWVENGGTMLITCDDTGHDAVCSAFGPVPSASDAQPPVNPTAASANHPVFLNGPFGSVAFLSMSGTKKYFDNTGGFTVLGEEQGDHPVILEKEIGSGRVILFTDVDMISDYTLTEGTAMTADNDRFLGNLFAYLAGEAGETFVINAGLNGNWWKGPDRNGEGTQLEVVLSNGQLTVVATVYSYDTSGDQVFLIAVGEVSGNSVDVNVYITEGGLWGAAFDPDLLDEDEWGTGNFTATSCNTVHLSLSPNAQYLARGFTNLAYDMVRVTAPVAPCPIDNPL